MLLTIRGDQDYSQVVQKFKDEHGLKKIIAFSGGSDTVMEGMPSDDPFQEQYKEFFKKFEERIIGDAIKKLSNYNIIILTGGTDLGVPNTATRIAKKYKMKTIGVYPLVGKKHALSENDLDLSLCVEPLVGESHWGDESTIFTNLLDGVIVFGGGAGTLVECAHLLKMNESIIKNGGPVKYIVPISGAGGVADGLNFVWGKAHVKALCMPLKKVTSGIEAVDILYDKLQLYDLENV
jgi:predicted Rossmann-fold nucleotide-binding protein